MIRVDVIRLAGDAGFGPMFTQAHLDALTRLVDLAQAAEREACAQVCDGYETPENAGYNYAGECAEAIRARGAPTASPQQP